MRLNLLVPLLAGCNIHWTTRSSGENWVQNRPPWGSGGDGAKTLPQLTTALGSKGPPSAMVRYELTGVGTQQLREEGLLTPSALANFLKN